MSAIVLTVEMQDELYRLLHAAYLDPNKTPHVVRLLDEIARARSARQAVTA